MESAYPMIGIDEAWQHIASTIKPLLPVELPFAQSLGHVLAEDVLAPEEMPPFRASAMDGYAVVAADQSHERRVIGEQDAGQHQALAVTPGTAVRIMTGAPLPKGADAVIPVEEATETDGYVHLPGAVSPGRYVRPVGQDLRAGDLVLPRGAVIGPPEVGLLATMGRTTASVCPRPKVAIMATGDELVPPAKTPGPGQIRDGNSYALAAAVTVSGFRAVSLGHIPDETTALRQAILEGVDQADMLLTSGGVSMGRRDLIKPLFEDLGVVHFGRVAVKPGKPLTYATVNGVPVFGLPGFPVSSLLALENFVRPALRMMAGHSKLWRPRTRVRLAHDVRHAPDRTEFQRAVVTEREGVYWAQTTGVQVSARLRSLVGANALIELPQGTGDVPAGAEVIALLVNQPEVSSKL